MDYEYSVIGSIFCNADTLAVCPAGPCPEFTYKGYTFSCHKFSDRISVSLRDTANDVCKNIPEADVTAICKFLSEKYACTVSMRKGYEAYGNSNVFNGGSDYEVLDEKWFSVEFENGIQKI